MSVLQINDPAEALQREEVSLLPGKTPVHPGQLSVAAAAAASVADCFVGSTTQFIEGCVQFTRFLTMYPDADTQEAFKRELVKRRLFSRGEVGARANISASKWSMLKKIGGHGSWLTQPEVLARLEAECSVVYQLCNLYESINGDGEEKLSTLVSKLASVEGKPSRDWLTSEVSRLKAPKFRDETAAAQVNPAATEAAAADADRDAADCVLLTPSVQHLRLITDGRDPDGLAKSLRRFKIADSATVIVMAPLRQYDAVANKLIRLLGFKAPSKICLAQQPDGCDVTDSVVCFIARRGETPDILIPHSGWFPAGLQPTDLARDLVPVAAMRLHIFAPAPTDGWQCAIAGDVFADTRRAA